MTLLPPGVKVHLALSYIDMRKGIDGLAMLVLACCGRIRSRARPDTVADLGAAVAVDRRC